MTFFNIKFIPNFYLQINGSFSKIYSNIIIFHLHRDLNMSDVSNVNCFFGITMHEYFFTYPYNSLSED